LANLIAGLDWISSVFVGAIIGGTSSAVGIPMVKQLKLGEKSTTTLFLESALSDVLCLIVGLAIFDGMKLGELEISAIFSKMWKAFLFAVLLGIAGGFLWSFSVYLIGLLIVLLIILARPISIQLFARRNNTFKEIAIMSVLTSKGLVPAVLASRPLQYGLINGDKIMDLGYSIVLFSIVICSILEIILGKDPLFFRKMIHKKKEKDELIIEETVSLIIKIT
jgi:NhaP-type Na+/H+ or K+/H+ antiporter